MAYIPKTKHPIREDMLSKPPIKPAFIIDLVIEYFDMPKEGIFKKIRKREVVWPRQVAMYLLSFNTRLSQQAIAVIFDKERTAVLHSIQTVEDLMATDPEVEDQITYLSDKILEHAKTLEYKNNGREQG